MPADPQPEDLEAKVRGIVQKLIALPTTAHVRELRAKAQTYGRVLRNWPAYPPTPAQRDAMTECVSELFEKAELARHEVRAARASMPSAPLIPFEPLEPNGASEPQRADADNTGVHTRSGPLSNRPPSNRTSMPPPSRNSVPPPLSRPSRPPSRMSIRPPAPPSSRNTSPPPHSPPPPRSSGSPPSSATMPASRSWSEDATSTTATPAPALLPKRRSR